MRAGALLLAAGLALAAQPAAAAGCRLALALALDVSSSVDGEEYALQAEGLAAALEDPAVAEAILGGRPVALAVFSWSGRFHQTLVADWTLPAGPGDLAALAGRVRAMHRRYASSPTALGHALSYARRLLDRAPPCERAVLDVSGDGETNQGYPPAEAYRAGGFAGVTVNALVVGAPDRKELVTYFQTEVLRGPGAFVETAADYADYARAMRRKLLRELAPPIVIGAAR